MGEMDGDPAEFVTSAGLLTGVKHRNCMKSFSSSGESASADYKAFPVALEKIY